MNIYKVKVQRWMMMLLLTMVSMGADAKVNVEIGTFTGGKITATQGEEKNGEVEITLTVTPDNGYTITKDDITVVATFAPQASRGNTRQKAPDLGSPLTLNGKDPADLSEKRDYTLTVDANLGVWVKEAKFMAKESGAKDGTDTSGTDYSGTYYIASCAKSENNGDAYTYDPDNPENNFYLCPTKGWIYYQSTSPYWNDNTPEQPFGQPFLTTFTCRSGATDPTTNQPYDEREAKWTLIKHPSRDCYYIRRNIDGKYLTLNGQLGNGATANRLRLHIEAQGNPNDNHLFAVEIQSTYLAISPINAKTSNKKWYLNVHQGNFNSLEGKEAAEKNEGPTGYKNIGGTIGIYSDKADRNAPWLLEDIILPVIEQQNDNKISITCSGCAIYYTTDNTSPDPNNYGEGKSTQLYDAPFEMTQPVTTVKAIAVKTKDTDETLDTYSRVVSLTTQRYIGSSNYYLFQNVEYTDYYMIPGDVVSNNTTVNTSSLFRPSMSWYFLNAGSEDGVQYYYIINGFTGDYLYRTSNSLYMKASSVFENTDNGYKFSIKQAYDTNNDPVAGFNIIPKGVTNTTYCIFKNGYADPVLANAKDNAVIGDNNVRNKSYGQWNFISAPDNKLPASLTYDSSNPADANWPTFLSSSSTTKYFKIENVGAEGYYMNPPENLSTGFVAATGTSTGGNELAWYVIEASHGDWQKYYYIIHAATGKYMYFTKTIPNDPKTMTGQSNVIALCEYDNTNAELYQFVFAKSTVDGAYYIVPKGLTEATCNKYYALYRDADNPTEPLKSTSNRLSDSYKWKFVSADLFCNNPEFVEEDGNIKIKCNTNAAKIYINTENNNEPTIDNGNLYDPTNNTNQNWSKDVQIRIKAIAVVSDGTNSISSQVTTLLNKPNVTLDPSYTNYAYDGNPHEPGISEVSIGEGADITIAPTSPATYLAESTDYSNNINVSTDENKAKVTLRDKEGDDWYIMNASTTFSIVKADITPTITIADWTYGSYDATINAPVITGNTDNSTETVEYKLTSAEETAYTTNVPTDAGDYTIRVTIAETDNCNGNTASNTFTIIPKTLTDDNIIITKNDDNTYSVSVVDGTDDLTLTTDYTLGEPTGSASSKYYVVPVNGANNYTGSLIAKYANAAFSQRGGSSDPWVATFITNSSGDGDYAAPEGMTVCIARDITGNLVTTENLDYIPENVPVILLSNNEAKGFQVKGRNGGTDITDGQRTGNWLKVDDEIQENVPMASFYLLYGGEFLLNMPGNLPARAIYLQKTGSSGARLRISKSQATGIEDGQPSIFQSPPAEVWHTLDGRRLSGKPAMKGLYIMNGNKTAIK